MAFKAEPGRHGMRHVVVRVRRPQTNGKIARVHKEIERCLPSFGAESSPTATRCDRPGGRFDVGGQFHTEGPRAPPDRLVARYNYERDHMSPCEGETPAEAYARKMPLGGRSRTGSRASRTGVSREGALLLGSYKSRSRHNANIHQQ